MATSQSQARLDKKDFLSKSIDYLKGDIQYLIDKKKTLNNHNEIAQIEMEKEEKISKLKTMTKQLSNIVREERQERQRQNDIRLVGHAVDSIEFGGARKKNDPEAITKAKRAKEIRDKAREMYSKYLKYEEQYNKIDPQDVPGMLFLHTSVVNAYGMCPYVKINVDTDDLVAETERIRDLRYNWLRGQEDGGNMFFGMYKKIIGTSDLEDEVAKLNDQHERIYAFLNNILTEQQRGLLDKTRECIEEYTNCHIKTKRLKEKFKSVIHNLSILYSETHVPVHYFFDIKYKTNVLVNDLDTEVEKNVHAKMEKMINADTFREMLNEYKSLHERCEQHKKYKSNTKRNLKNELYMYITEQSKNEDRRVEQCVVQCGKYFKRWAILSETERNERFESFANFHVQKFMVNQNILKEEEKGEMIVNLTELLTDSYKKKHLIYRDFKWNTQKGCIETMHVLRYDKDKGFYLAKHAGNQAEKRKASKTKRSTFVKSVVTKESEKTINEEILHYIVKKIQSSEESAADLTKDDKDKCMENIKAKLNLKKIGVNDKTLIYNKIEDIFNVVKINSCGNKSVALI